MSPPSGWGRGAGQVSEEGSVAASGEALAPGGLSGQRRWDRLGENAAREEPETPG